MNVTKPQDTKAETITFGLELETAIPVNSGVNVGGYHSGAPVHGGRTVLGQIVEAPRFGQATWRADRDSSIRTPDGLHNPCEFVSPILFGQAGVENVRQMVSFIKSIGGKVNDSCGCHITLGIESVIGPATPAQIADFCRKLAHVAQSHAWAIYAQTGTGRHANPYSQSLSLDVERIMQELVANPNDTVRASTLAQQCGRGMINFRKAFTLKVVEFRAFAGTLNIHKILHHIATAIGLMRRAATVQTFGRFDRKATKKHSNVANAEAAVRRLWRVLGWVDSVPGRDCALGLFGPLHAEFGTYRKTALAMAAKFEQSHPNANL